MGRVRGDFVENKLTDEAAGRVNIRVRGRFRINAPDGTNITPISSKGQGLVALLVTDSEFERTRAWLQDKLWSDRGQEQGARSLRQELLQLKKSLGPHSHILEANRKSVWLNPETVRLDDDQGGTRDGVENEFLEGLEVRDDEFNLWLATQRALDDPQTYEPASQFPRRSDVGSHPGGSSQAMSAPGRAVAIVGDASSAVGPRILVGQFVDAMAKTLNDICDIDTFDQLPPSLAAYGLVASVSVIERIQGEHHVRFKLEDTSTAATLWSETCSYRLGDPGDTELSVEVLAIINRLFGAICTRLSDREDFAGPLLPAKLAALAVMKSFSINVKELEEAKSLFAQAFEGDKRGVYLAWQAQVTVIQIVERFALADAALKEQGDYLCAEAIRLDPTNSHVLAAVANYRTIIDQNQAAGLELARLAVRANPANPLAWWAWSNAVQYFGDRDNAYRAALRAHQLSTGSRMEFWSAFQRSLAAIVSRKNVEGRRYGELASALQPSFRPPLRYLAALHSTLEDVSGGKKAVERLKRYEPDFTIDRFIRDEDYPVRLMRAEGLLNPYWAEKFE